MSFKLSFHGGAGTVTGSNYLLETGRERTLIDCGLFQGYRELREANCRRPAFQPSEIAVAEETRICGRDDLRRFGARHLA